MNPHEKEHLDFVLDNAAECTVLLKCDSFFPLESKGRIDAFGSGVRHTVKGGTGSGEVNSHFTYTIEEGLEKEGFVITSKKWLDSYDLIREKSRKSFITELKNEAKRKHENLISFAMGKTPREPEYDLPLEKNADCAVYVVSRNSGEGSDREVREGDVLLSKSEIRDILALNAMYDSFMLVLNTGGVVDLSPVMKVRNILVLSQLGVNCGKVLSDILLGKKNPSGKLSTTWAVASSYYPAAMTIDRDESRYTEGVFVGYRYFDTVGKEPLFCFGHGLSYTVFDVNTLEVTLDREVVSVKVSVTNTGGFSGKEVIQLYLSSPSGRLPKPYQALCAFSKTDLLSPSESQVLEMSFSLSDFASFDEKSSSYILEKGTYVLRVGTSSKDTKAQALFELDETVVTKTVRSCLSKPDFEDEVFCVRREESFGEIRSFRLSKDDFKTRCVSYDTSCEVHPMVKDLSVEELSYLVTGGFDPNAKGLSIIGNAARKVAGAAGETTGVLEDRGIRRIVMADGPAGLRLAKHYYESDGSAFDASGAGMIPQSVLEVMNPFVRFVAKLVTGGAKRIPKSAVIKDHYATMIPIGTAIAQSFNCSLARAFGDIVGKEMQMMGVQFWLAPALNIHRSILCGRNFEYYSEDPLLSGMIAGAITEGVQSHEGCGVTIKHYAANNIETNRYGNNSQVSERAMREIYLKGFEICIRTSKPKAVMTSYNLLNGVHTSEHSGLLDILRCEMGFDGIVMTDWVISAMTEKSAAHRNALSDEVIIAGGDLFMPGSRKDYENILRSYEQGRLSRKRLEVSAGRIISMSEKLCGN